MKTLLGLTMFIISCLLCIGLVLWNSKAEEQAKKGDNTSKYVLIAVVIIIFIVGIVGSWND